MKVTSRSSQATSQSRVMFQMKRITPSMSAPKVEMFWGR